MTGRGRVSSPYDAIPVRQSNRRRYDGRAIPDDCVARLVALPAQADLNRNFEVSPASVHQMVLALERLGLIRRIPGQACSLEVLVAPEDLPPL